MRAMENLQPGRAGGKAIEKAAKRALFMRAARVLDRMIERGVPAGKQ